MPLDPAILALILASLTQTLMLLRAAGFAIQIRRHWDLSSGGPISSLPWSPGP